jgi:general secretion pathway protein D
MQRTVSRAVRPSPPSTANRSARLAPVLALLLAWGCSGFAEYRQAQIAEQEGNWDAAVLHYMDLVSREPEDLTYRAALLRAKMRASQAHFEAGRSFSEAGSLERALFEFRQAVELDPTNQYAATELEKVRQALVARQREQGELLTLDEMKREAQARSQPPLLEPRSNEPISLEFPSPVAVKDIYRALGDAFGINILFDPNLRDQEIAIELTQVTAQDALEILMRAAQHFYKVLDEHTILIAADTPQNRRAYEDLVIQTFFLSNSEVKDVMVMLRTLVDAKKIAQNERLNAIIMRDSADRVKVAERLIQSNDKARAEVVVDVELLQVSSGSFRDIGMQLSQYSIGQGFAPGVDLDTTAGGTQLSVNDLQNLNRNYWMLTVPSFLYSFVKNNSDAQVLARPQLRISEGEKASLHIGDKVPIPTTTFNTANTVGSNIVPVTSFQYTDVGIKINIEPRVHHNLEVTLKVRIEVSNIARFVTGSGGQEQPVIGTRTIETVIRLKDGETNFLAGLLRTDESTREDAIPGLSEIPVLGRLFTRNNRNNERTDVILTMTPHIIRRSDITEDDLAAIWVGTEQNITFRASSPRVESDVEGPFDEGASAAERVRELIRQRVQELPRGLDEEGMLEGEDGVGEEEAPEAPPGVDLVPPAFPSETPPPDEGEEEPFEEEEEPPGGLAAAPGVPEPDPVLMATDQGTGVAPDVPVDAPEGEVTLAAARRQPPAVALRLVPGRLQVEAGDEFELRLEATAGTPLSHLPLVLTFDPRVLEVTGWERGGLLGGVGEVELLAAEQEPGKLLVGVSRLGELPGVTGKGIAAVLRFRAKQPGRATVALLRPKAMGPGLVMLAPVTARPSRVTVAPAPRAAEPLHGGKEGADV